MYLWHCVKWVAVIEIPSTQPRSSKNFQVYNNNNNNNKLYLLLCRHGKKAQGLSQALSESLKIRQCPLRNRNAKSALNMGINSEFICMV